MDGVESVLDVVKEGVVASKAPILHCHWAIFGHVGELLAAGFFVERRRDGVAFEVDQAFVHDGEDASV